LIRGLITLPILVAALAPGGLYRADGEVDPCRVLALEEARRGKEAMGGLPVESGLESWHRLGTSQMSTGRCVTKLTQSWANGSPMRSTEARVH
jgi:hypothetical protein